MPQQIISNTLPGKNTTAIARMAAGPAGLEVRLVVRLYGVPLGAPRADPLPLATVFPTEMLLDPDKISERMAWVVVETTRLGTDEHSLSYFTLSLPLHQLPRNLVPSTVHLQVLVPLETLVAYFTYIPIRLEKGTRGQ